MRTNLLILSILLIGLFGCSSSLNPIIPIPDDSFLPEIIQVSNYLPVGITDISKDGRPVAGIGTMGVFQMSIDTSTLTSELISLRQNALVDVLETVDITNFLQLAPCTDCAKIRSVSIDADGNVVASIGLKHPFEEGDPFKPITGRNRGDLHVFNVEGIVISNNPVISFTDIGSHIADFQLLNASGYTGYLNSVLDLFYPTEATIHPYILHFDDYSAGNYDPGYPMGFQSVTTPHPTGNLVMAMGSEYHYKDYIFKPEIAFDFIYAVGCTYGVSSASKADRFAPEYRVPQHNKKAASEISIEIIENNLIEENTDSSATLRINVVDVNHVVEIGTALNQMLADSSVSEISLEIPGLTVGAMDIPATPLSGTGHNPDDPLVFEVTILNSTGNMAGTYTGLVKVTDSYLPGLNESPLLDNNDGIQRVDPLENPLTGIFAIDEFATYQVFTINVSEDPSFIQILVPNGGEVWTGNTNNDITWIDSGDIEFVDIFYSKDDFLSETITIIENFENIGSYRWFVPDDPSTTVKLKIVASGGILQDISDDFFTILEALPETGWLQGYFNSENHCWNPASIVELPLTEVWRTDLTRQSHSSIAIRDDQLWITASSGYLQSYDATDGSFMWEKNVRTGETNFWAGFNPLLWGDKVISGGMGIFSIDAVAGGDPDWEYMTGSDFMHKGGVIVGDNLFWRSCHNRFYSIDLNTGTQNWNASGATFPLFNPAANENYVVYPSGNSVQCYTADGSFKWTSNIGGNFYGAPLIIENKVHFGYQDLRCVDLESGNVQWLTPYDEDYSFVTSLVWADDRIISMARLDGSSPMRLYCFDFDGNKLWSLDLGICQTTGAYSNGYYFCMGQQSGSSIYQLLAIDVSDGSIEQAVGSFFNSWGGVVSANNRLYFADQNSKLYCFE